MRAFVIGRARRGAASRRVAVALGCAALVAVAGCGHRHDATVEPEVHLPPDVVAVHPAARARQVSDHTDIWAEFGEPLDSATVSASSVFLKLDTRRVPVTVTYESATRRIRLALHFGLDLRHTYTVELTPALATADGRRFSETWYWQFTTNSVRRPSTPAPDSGAVNESPVAMLKWAGTEASAGDIVYRVFQGSDSSAVSAHSVTPIEVVNHSYYLPDSSWGLGRTVFWSLSTLNRSTGEESSGPTWRFSTIPAGTPIDSMTFRPTFYAFMRSGAARPTCNNGSFSTAPDVVCAMKFPFELLPAGARLAGVELVMTPNQTTSLPSRTPYLWSTINAVTSCAIGFPGPPYADEGQGPLATGDIVSQFGRTRFRLANAHLAAFVEAMARYGGLYGFLLRSNVLTTWVSPTNGEFDFRFRVYYFRP
jgi:hypothetical protein